MKFMKRTALAVCCAATLASAVGTAHAANWIMLQGTEAPSATPTAVVWGFLQPLYSYTDGTPLSAGTPFAGQKAVFNQIVPDLKSSSQFQVQRARVGVRGQNFPLNSNINYFFLAEFGNNGVNADVAGSARATDASVTFSYIPGVRVRTGLFKTPGSDEPLQAIHTFDYINFTNVSDQMLLERFFNRTGTTTAPGEVCRTSDGGTAATCANNPNGPVSAFRDIGVQLFDAFTFGNIELTYAAMLGNGNGINRGDNDASTEQYYYLAGEWVLGGAGPRREGLKFFAWSQDGTRQVITGGTGSQDGLGGGGAVAGTLRKFDRTRTGAGVTFRKSVYRAAAEYIKADGMIFEGTDGGAVAGTVNTGAIGPNAPGTSFASFNITPVGKADGYYLDIGFQVIPSKLELDLRYDKLNRRTDLASAERTFETTTVGLQWFFDPKTRVTFNYEFRKAEAPNLPSSNAANRILNSLDNRIGLQATAIF